MTEDLEEFIDALNIVVYTLVDGSRVIGEERSYDYTNGITQVYGVLEFSSFNNISTISPYVPEMIDSVFVFIDRNVIGRSNATFDLKKVYYDSLLKFRLKQVMTEEEYNKFMKTNNKLIPPLESKGNLKNIDWTPPFSRN